MHLIKQIAVSVAAFVAATSLVCGAGQQASESSRSKAIAGVGQVQRPPVLPTSVGLSAQQSPGGPSHPQTFTQIDVPGATNTYLTGINPRGDSVGYYLDSSFRAHGLLLNALNFDPNPIYTAHGDFTNTDLIFTTPSLTAGQNYIIAVTADEGSSFDAIVTLKDPNGNIVVNAQDTGINETINFSAEVTGQYTIIVMSFGGTRGLFTVNVYNGVTTIDVPGAMFGTQANGINPQGDIVGSYDFHGFLLSNGVFTTIDAPGAFFTIASGINRQGDIVGIYQDTNFTYHGFLLSNGVFTTIDAPGTTTYTDAHGINSRGDIVGRYDGSSGSHGFLLSNGSFTTIDVPGAASTEAFGINRQGDIVGDFFDSSFNFRGFLLRNGKFSTIDRVNGTEALGINPQDDIVGEVYDSSFGAHGYLLSR